jgi:putative tryptophan/tyrosine transport system substrate-binding protein
MWCRTVGGMVQLLLSLLVAPLLAMAQPTGQVRRLGMLRAGITTTDAERKFEAFRQGLRDLGWGEGQNLVMAYRAAEGQVERLPVLGADLLQLPVEGLVTAGGRNATVAAMVATRTVRIVMATGPDPVGAGLVASMARPGGTSRARRPCIQRS